MSPLKKVRYCQAVRQPQDYFGTYNFNNNNRFCPPRRICSEWKNIKNYFFKWTHLYNSINIK